MPMFLGSCGPEPRASRLLASGAKAPDALRAAHLGLRSRPRSGLADLEVLGANLGGVGDDRDPLAQVVRLGEEPGRPERERVPGSAAEMGWFEGALARALH